MSSFSPTSRPLLAATLVSLFLGSTHGGNLDETVEFREYIFEGLRNVKWDGNKEVGDLTFVDRNFPYPRAQRTNDGNS